MCHIHSIALSRFSWTFREIEDAENASLLVAADVIYSDDLTDAFFSTLKRLMSRGSRKVYVMAFMGLENAVWYVLFLCLKHLLGFETSHEIGISH